LTLVKTCITLHHAEVLENDELGTRPLRTAKAIDTYTLAGYTSGESWSPTFTFHGNIAWSMHGNFTSLPTDCPQRDERLGWTGDIALFAPTATLLYDCNGLLKSWLKDVWID